MSSKSILVKAPQLAQKKISLNTEYMSEATIGTDIILVNDGEVYVAVNGISYTVTTDEIMLLPALPYQITPIGRTELSLAFFNLQGFAYSGLPENQWPFLEHEVLFAKGNATAQIAAAIRLIETELADKLVGYEKSCARLVEYLLILLERNLVKKEDRNINDKNMLDNIREYIDKNYEKNITLASLSEQFYISPFHISHMFKEKYQISPIQYLIHARIKIASELLRETNRTIFDISNMVGYPNVNYFHILFKRFTGMSPGKYRKAKP